MQLRVGYQPLKAGIVGKIIGFLKTDFNLLTCLCFKIHCKLVHPSQSQNHATFTPHIESLLRIFSFLVFLLNTWDCQFLQNILSKKNPKFPFYYPNFKPLFHLIYRNIHIEAFPQSCRYVQYLSFATLVHLVTVLGPEEFAFRCYNFFLQTSAAEVPSMGRNQNWSFFWQNKGKSPCLFSSLLDLQYTKKDLRPSGESCCMGDLGHVIEFQKFHVFETNLKSITNMNQFNIIQIFGTHLYGSTKLQKFVKPNSQQK